MAYRFFVLAILLSFVLWPYTSSAETRTIVFPVDGESSFRDDFREPRAGGSREHLGIDIIADKMTPLVAVVDGIVSFVVRPEASWGYSVTIIDKDGYQYRYLHINNDNPGTDDGNGGEANAYAPGIQRGAEVKANQLIGWVGDSGNAENTVSHLHFEIRTRARVPINPYDSLVNAAPSANFVGSNVFVTHESAGEVGVEEGSKYIFSGELREGMQGPAIQELQIRLEDEGYFSHMLTEYFGPETKIALEKYQRANNIAPTGVLGYAARSLLNRDPVGPGVTLRLEEDLFEGMEGEAVLQLQLKLKELGYYDFTQPIFNVGPVMGVFDVVTREALRKFQVETNISPTGYLDYNTWNKLNDAYATALKFVQIQGAGSNITRALSIGTSGEDVKILQNQLQILGFFSNSVSLTGYFGPVTRTAVQDFQKKYEIVSSGDESTTGYGLVGPKTRVKLAEVLATAQPQQPAAASNEIQVLQAQISALLEQVKILQAQLQVIQN